MPLCGPLSLQTWLEHPKAEEEPREDEHEDRRDYLARVEMLGVGPGLLNEEAGCPYHCSQHSFPLAGPETPACNTQAGKDFSEDKTVTKEEYLSVLQNLNAPTVA